MTRDDADRIVLEERARALARPRHDRRSHVQEARGLALFERGGTVYAVERGAVFEATRVLPPTPLPRSAPHWLGIASLHGELIAVVDLAVLLGGALPPSPVAVPIDDLDAADGEERQLVIVLGNGRRELAVVVDAVREPRDATETLAVAPGTEHGTARLVVGTTDDGVRVLDAAALLADPRLRLEAETSSET